jgi:hypothetical protein
MVKITRNNRDEILAEHINRLIDGMTVEALIDHVRSSLEADYNHYTNNELEWEIIDSWNEFPWEDFDYE